jgi:signal transduction histidine kinase
MRETDPVLLGRLRIRGKLAALVMAPLLVVVSLTIGLTAGQVGRASDAANTVRSVDVASQIGVVVADLQEERLASVAFLAGAASAADVALKSADVGDEITDVEANLGASLPAPIRQAISASSSLDPLRAKIAERTGSPDDVVTGFGAVIGGILDALRLVDGVDATTEAGREVVALDALLRIDELNSESAALLLTVAHGQSAGSIVAYGSDRSAITLLMSRFTAYATTEQIDLYGLVTQAFIQRTGTGFAQSFAKSPQQTVASLTPQVLYPAMESFIVLGGFVEKKISTDVTTAVTGQHNTDLLEAYGTSGLVLLVLLGVGFLNVTVARSVAQPLIALTVSAERVARVTEAELLRVADDESESVEPVRLEPVPIAASDEANEIGELARAFERVQGTAALLVERQVASRRNVAQMFGHVGRRTQNLVGRQVALIDALEFEETDSNRLADLYRLDHVTSRLRRNAGSLVVLSGAADSGEYVAPLPLADVVRLGLGEIEGYTRVDVDVPANLAVAPARINDLVQILAELMENATAFSPPHTRVTVTADHERLTIVDHGIGLAPERISEENARLAQRERLDLAPTEVLGLFVVGRLARRHEITVELSSTPGGGLTAVVNMRSDSLPPAAVGAPTPTLSATAFEATPLEPTSAELTRFEVRPFELTPFDRATLDSIAAQAFDREPIDRAKRVLSSGPTWNAFEVGDPRQLTAPSAAVDSPTIEFRPVTIPVRAAVQAPPAPQAPEAPVRVATEAPARSAPQAPMRPVPQAPAEPVPQAPAPPVLTPRAPQGDPTASMGGGSAGGATLTRRVPGATLPTEAPVVQPRHRQPQDPDEARDLVAQFEMGVARALREVGPEPSNEEGSP